MWRQAFLIASTSSPIKKSRSKTIGALSLLMEMNLHHLFSRTVPSLILEVILQIVQTVGRVQRSSKCTLHADFFNNFHVGVFGRAC